ncbi:MAG: DUF6753 family protein [Myxococcales bacterium]
MTDLESSFTQLLGRQASDREKQDLYRARDALNLKDNDAVWLLLMALGHYETLYAKVPAMMAKAAGDVTAAVQKAAEAQVKATVARVHADLGAAVAQTAAEIAGRRTTAQKLQWAAVCIGTALVALLVVGWFGFRKGVEMGYARGWAKADDTGRIAASAASWANTPEGRLAYGLMQAGSIRELAECSGRGWSAKDGMCWPQMEKGKIHGWRLAIGAPKGR